MEKRGYDVSSIEVPAIPQGKVLKADIEQLRTINKFRYQNSTKHVIYFGDTKTGPELIEETVTGYRARQLERQHSANRGENTKRKIKYLLTSDQRENYRKLQQLEKEHLIVKGSAKEKLNEYVERATSKYSSTASILENYSDYLDSGFTTTTIETPSSSSIDNTTPAPDYTNYGEGYEDFDWHSYPHKLMDGDLDIITWYDPTTGETVDRYRIQGMPDWMPDAHVIMSKEEVTQTLLENAINDLRKLEERGGATGTNASKIRTFIEEEAMKNDPEIIEDLIEFMGGLGSWHSYQYGYKTKGGQAYVRKFKRALKKMKKGSNLRLVPDEGDEEENIE